MSMNIDVSDVKTMGQFRIGIQNAVEDYVTNETDSIINRIQGFHGKKTYLNVFQGGASETENKTIEINLSETLADKSQYWAIFNIVNKQAYDAYDKKSMFGAQIIAWQNDKGFEYTIPRNTLYVECRGSSILVRQYIKDVSFNKSTNVLKITICNTFLSGGYSDANTKQGSYVIDYHIW